MSQRIDPNRRVQVYRNLHTGKWSVRQGGKVVAHLHRIDLKDARFLVQPAGRRRTVETGQKTVHATISGYVTEPFVLVGEAITYNPFKYETFVRRKDETPVTAAQWVTLNTELGALAVMAVGVK